MHQPTPTRQSTSLVHDTIYRRGRRRSVDVLHNVDDCLWRWAGKPKRLLFDAGSPMNAVILKPLYERLRGDPRLDLCWTVPERVGPAERILGAAGISARVVPQSTAVWMKADAYLSADFWDSTWLYRRLCRLHLFHGVAGKYTLDAPVEVAPTVASFDCLMFVNTDRRDRYIAAGLVPDDQVKAALVGYPKVDCLVDGSLDRNAIARDLGLDTRVPTVIYAPTWSPYSSLNTMGEEIIERLAAEGLQVIVKLHDRSYDLQERASGGVDWAARLSCFDSHPRIRVVHDPDSCPFLTAADAMVSDHSSIAFEYMLLDRPIVVVDCPELIAGAKINVDKVRRLRSAAEVVARPVDVAGAVVNALRNPDARAEQRRRTARELFHEPGTATDRAVELVYRLIGLPACRQSSTALESDRSVAALG